jgi:hypothetical protein
MMSGDTMSNTDLKQLGSLNLNISDIEGLVEAITEDGNAIMLFVEPITLISAAAGIIGSALQSGQNWRINEGLSHIENKLEAIQTSLLLVIDLLKNMGAIIRDADRQNTIEFIKTNLLAQIDVFVHKLPELESHPERAHKIAQKLLDQFETPAAQIRRYGPMTADTSAIAMLHLYALYEYANEYKPNRKMVFQQYKNILMMYVTNLSMDLSVIWLN